MESEDRKPEMESGKTPSVDWRVTPTSELPIGYTDFLADLKTRIRSAQAKAALSVNRELVLLYWDIGQRILEQQRREGWGTKVIDSLAVDLKRAFPAMKGFSPRNLKYMRSFAEAYPDSYFVQQVVAQIPWGHNVRILDHIKDPDERAWYAHQTIENGWSRNVLLHQIESGLYQRKGKAISNFPRTLPPTNSDLVQQTLKDPYVFDFLMLDENVRESELERALTKHIREFLLELGAGFAFVGRQVHLEVDQQDFYLDLLFYHLRLRCFVVIAVVSG